MHPIELPALSWSKVDAILKLTKAETMCRYD